MSAELLGQLREAAAKAAAARYVLHALVRHSHAEGLSLRAIAQEASMSHENVRRICASEDLNLADELHRANT